jgi:hypothetical protein
MDASNELSFNNSYVLQSIFPNEIADRISEFAAEVEEEEEEEEESPFDWDVVWGTVEIYRTRHIITWDGIRGQGGYVFLYREHRAGWYRWNRLGEHPRYEMLDGTLAQKIEDDRTEYLAEVPLDFEYDGEEDIIILDDELMLMIRLGDEGD